MYSAVYKIRAAEPQREDGLRLRTEEKRRAILEAARSVFLERGYDAASMAEVSARAGGSKQTLYSYFSSKEELFVAVILEVGGPIFEPLFENLRASRDLPRALRDLAVAYLRLISQEEFLAYRRIILAEGAKSNLGRLAFENGPKRCWDRLADAFRDAMDQGRMRRADPWRAVGHFFGLCNAGPAERLLEGVIMTVSDAELVETAEAAAEVFIRGYEVRDADAELPSGRDGRLRRHAASASLTP